MKTNNVRVLERAIVPRIPVQPEAGAEPVDRALPAVSGSGIGLAFAIEALDNTLKTQADVEQFLGVPVLGWCRSSAQGKAKADARERSE